MCNFTRRAVMPTMVQAVKTYATLGEIADTLVDIYGRFVEPTHFSWRSVSS